MNARAEHLSSPATRIAAGGKSEHISLESKPDITAAPPRPPHRKVRATFKLRSALRGCATELSILEDHYLAVHMQRSREAPKKYVFDLRFANPKPVRVRQIAWVCLAAAIALLLIAGGAIWWGMTAVASFWTHPGWFIAGGACLLAGVATLFFLRRTTESLEFTSTHGGATLVGVLGGIGSGKRGKLFFVDLIKSINAAKLARPQTKPDLLRDEMREHHRLRELNVLSEKEYAASQARILAAHSAR